MKFVRRHACWVWDIKKCVCPYYDVNKDPQLSELCMAGTQFKKRKPCAIKTVQYTSLPNMYYYCRCKFSYLLARTTQQYNFLKWTTRCQRVDKPSRYHGEND